MRSREATEPRPCSFTISLATGSSARTNSLVPSVHPSAVIRISCGAGSSRRSMAHVLFNSSRRFLVVIMIENPGVKLFPPEDISLPDADDTSRHAHHRCHGGDIFGVNASGADERP